MTTHVPRGRNFPLFLVVCVFKRIVPIGPGGFLRAVPTLTFMLILTLARESWPVGTRPRRHRSSKSCTPPYDHWPVFVPAFKFHGCLEAV
jgi:hypothetical protein